ncbi:MAG: metallophosphoesterase [Myxococcales bacterium]|nr:metallophosphoesterase [Myxococcales bacterium]
MTVASHLRYKPRAVRRTTLALAAALSLHGGRALADERLAKGPWLMDLHADSAVVMAERGSPGRLHLRAQPDAAPGADAGPPLEIDSQGRDGIYEFELRALRPGTRYRYTVSGPGITAAEGQFATPPTTPAPFRFAIYGDTRSHESAHRAVVEALVREGPEFVIHTGDLIEDGRNPLLWQQFFEIEAPLLARTAFVPVIGNHEIVHPRTSGIDNYRRYVHVSPDGPSPELDATFQYGNVRFVLANSYDDWSGPARDWLSTQLATARREDPTGWLIVVMHWGPRSSGPHGDNERLLSSGVEAIMRRHRVDLCISGHDHLYERGDDDGLRYIVSGGGGAPLYERDAHRAMTRRFVSEHHYLRAEVDPERIRFTVLRPDGSEIERVSLGRDGWSDPRPGAPAPDAGATPRPVTPPEAPYDPKPLVKVLPLLAAVALGAWWLKRQQR